jgi:hypothetical protein
VPGDATDAARQPLRFVYQSGSQPLQGYTIKRGVGQGGFGEIYYALSDAGKEVALKLIRRNLEVELRGIRQCLNLKHPNLLDLYDIRQDSTGDTWVIMEYMAGQCLENVMAEHPHGLPPDVALEWIHGIGGGVAYLHDHGIVHRDLKPGNVFSDEGMVKVGDYGLSKFVSCSRRSGQTESIGTVHYMAPEVANGRYGKEIDIYAMGIMLYEMLTGQPPFDGESIGEVLMKHLTARPDVSMLAEPYRSVVSRALEKDPALRYPTVREFLAALPPRPASSSAAMPSATFAAPQPQQSAEAPVVAEVVDDEPVLRAVKNKLRRLRARWDTFSEGKKYAVAVLGIVVLVHFGALLMPLAVTVLMAYGVYRLIRMVVLSLIAPPICRPLPPPTMPQSPPPAREEVRPAPRSLPPRAPLPEKPAIASVLKPPRERIAELLGSLLISALVVLAMSVVMILVSSYRGVTPQPEQCAWLILVGIAGSWIVLAASKFWEGTNGDPMLRRFILMVAGLALGLLAYGVADALWVNLPPNDNLPSGPHVAVAMPQALHYRLPSTFYGDDGRPLAMAFMAAFATLLALLRWWRQADPLRSSRLKLGSVIVTAIWAAIVAGLWHFPQPWLIMAAATMSVAVQLAAPWTPTQQRPRTQGRREA